MRSCLSAVTSGIAVVLIAVVPGTLVSGVPAAAGVPPQPATMTAHYGFNGRSSSIIDESGNGHTLRVISFQGGRVRPVVHGPGTALAFPGKCSDRICPQVALQSDDSADLNPGTRDIAFGADVLLGPGQTSSGQNVLQKGYSTISSQYKLQIDGAAGHPSCVLVDVRKPKIRVVRSVIAVADNRWHRVRCQRHGTRWEIYVDEVLRGRSTVPAKLSVANGLPLSIGGKGFYRDNDQFNGVLDNVWVRIDR
ncbi:LamG-like jellyroll fold domain-containing protein [Actinoplanes derwentensis]|uniref:Concanavalin A-like lectin/glucanases superfamily protein n=1 Tax=Actinoplanes derwentensis TaxID=113562 RepID=A0A1H2CN22_9ACTN|nr:LamG-like jellyroll fold domain-containing protein [Actinoplanes derwentensis]SDT71910.1 Concanavalin A-like lectin/glucanases superfamily protein [Actinoplanes derwentensis]